MDSCEEIRVNKKMNKKRLTRSLLLAMGARAHKNLPDDLQFGDYFIEKCRGGWNIYTDLPYSPEYVTTVAELFEYVYKHGHKDGRKSACSNIGDIIIPLLKHESGEC